MPFHFGPHPTTLVFVPRGSVIPPGVDRNPFGNQRLAFSVWRAHHQVNGLEMPFFPEIEAERVERDTVPPPPPPPLPEPQPQVAPDGFNIFDAPVFPLPPRRRAAVPPPPRVAIEYRAPSEVIIESITKQPFFMPYDTLNEIRLRLRNSVIKIDGRPVHVIDVAETRGRTFEVYYRLEENADTIKRDYGRENGFDLSPLPARYVLSHPGHRNANWAYRVPARGIYQQGGNRQNTFIRRSGDGAKQTIGSEMNIVKSYLESNRVLGVGEAFAKVGDNRIAMPCSDHVAVFAYNRKCGIEYHGIQLSEFSPADISNGHLKIKTEIPLTPLMEKRLNDVGISIAS